MVGKRQLDLHGLVTIVRWVSCNVYYTAVAAKIVSKWKLKNCKDRKPKDMRTGEFLVNVKPHLPDGLKTVFREHQVVSICRDKDGGRKLEEGAAAALVSLTTDTATSGFEREKLNAIYKQVADCVYSDDAEGGNPEPVQSPGRKTPSRKRKSVGSSHKRTSQGAPTKDGPGKESPKKASVTGAVRCEAVKREKVERLLKNYRIVTEKVKVAPGLSLTVWCCRLAFSVSDKCTLAYCMECKEVRCGSVEARGGRGRARRRESNSGLVGKEVTCCKKGDCRRQTEADLEDLEVHTITKDCLKETRKKKNERRWERIAEHCWGCGEVFLRDDDNEVEAITAEFQK